jgi:hypothetical protein
MSVRTRQQANEAAGGAEQVCEKSAKWRIYHVLFSNELEKGYEYEKKEFLA